MYPASGAMKSGCAGCNMRWPSGLEFSGHLISFNVRAGTYGLATLGTATNLNPLSVKRAPITGQCGPDYTVQALRKSEALSVCLRTA